MGNTTSKKIIGFDRYAFTESITVTGDFLSISVDRKELVRNCNFNFNSDNITTYNIDGMFDGCINAVFSSHLIIDSDSTINSASKAFRDCKCAKLPVVSIGDSEILTCDHMFENCTVAELSGVQIPHNAKVFNGMFRNAKSAYFNELSTIPAGDGNYHELFSGCENGVFDNLEFTYVDNMDVDCGFMFYYCSNMDCDNMHFERISNNITDASYMFYSAGSNSSKTFNDAIYEFSNLSDCNYMFAKSNFMFNNSYFRFNGKVQSIANMFSECEYCNELSPVVILGHLSDGDFELSSINEQLDKRLDGHYTRSLNGCIVDFTSLYEGSKFSTLELRGISNNGFIVSEKMGAVQNFTSMCKDCDRLERISGYLPSCASTYDHMFSGCDSLTADISELFKTQPYGWTDVSNLVDSFNGDGAFESYSMTSINGMFDCHGFLYSGNDKFDIVGLFKTVERNLYQSGYDSKKMIFESIKNSLPPIRIATKNSIPELGSVRYDITGISENSGTIRYNSFVDDFIESGKYLKSSAEVDYGIHSDYAKSAFGHGFYRYGGEFMGDSGKCFFVIYRPKIDDVTGVIVGFESDYIDYNVDLRPNGWGDKFNTDSSKGYWNEFSYDRLYPAMICRNDGTFIKFAYVGGYTRTYHENRGNDNIGTYEYVTNFDMPVTFFDGYESNIVPL